MMTAESNFRFRCYRTPMTDAAATRLAAKLKTPLQIGQHLVRAFEAGFGVGARPIDETVVEAVLLPQGDPPALPGWLSEFDISGSMFFAVWARIARVCAAALYCTMVGCEKAPLRGPQP